MKKNKNIFKDVVACFEFFEASKNVVFSVINYDNEAPWLPSILSSVNAIIDLYRTRIEPQAVEYLTSLGKESYRVNNATITITEPHATGPLKGTRLNVNFDSICKCNCDK